MQLNGRKAYAQEIDPITGDAIGSVTAIEPGTRVGDVLPPDSEAATQTGLITPDYVVIPGDFVAHCPRLESGRTLENITAKAGVLAISLAGAMLNPYLGYAILQAGWFAVDRWLPLQEPLEETQNRYGLTGPRNLDAQISLPYNIIYGKALVTPLMKDRVLDPFTYGNIFNALFSVAGHYVDGLLDSTHEIYANSIALNYDTDEDELYIDATTPPILKCHKRSGTLNQTTIRGFNRTNYEFPGELTSVTLTTDSEVSLGTIQSTQTNATVVKVYFKFPNGVFEWNNANKEMRELRISYKAEITDVSTSTIVSTKLGTVIDSSNSPIYEYRGEWDLPAGQYEVEMKARLVGVSSIDTRYEHGNTIQFMAITTASEDNLTYPGEALIGMSAYNNEETQGAFQFDCEVERSQVYVWDADAATPAWSLKNANNPAWAVWDMLCNGHPDHPMQQPYTTYATADGSSYGAALSPSALDYTSFSDWADFCDDNDFEVNIAFTQSTTLFDAIQTVCRLGRGIFLCTGSQFRVIWDDATDPTQMFGEGNIVSGSFETSWVTEEEQPNRLNITIADAENAYNATTITIESDTISTDGYVNETTVRMDGCTSRDMASNHGRYLLDCARYRKRMVTFETGADALACEIGDVVKVQADTTYWGEGGRIVDSRMNWVKNSFFALDGDNWSTYYPSSIDWEIVTTDPVYGDNCLHWEATATNPNSAEVHQGLSDLNLTDDDTITFSCNLKVITNDGGADHQPRLQFVYATIIGGIQTIHYARATVTYLSDWETISTTVTPSDPIDDTFTPYIQFIGNGEAYADTVMVEKAATFTTFVPGTCAELDKIPTLDPTQSYRLQIRDSATDAIDSNIATSVPLIEGFPPARFYGLSFDGNDDYVQFPATTFVSTHNFSFGTWVYPSKKTVRIVDQNNTFFASISYFQKFSVRTYPHYNFDSGTVLDYNEWVHVGFTFNNGIGKCYINGECVSTGTGSYNYVYTTAQPMWMGKRYSVGTECYRGNIVDTVITNTTLSDAEMKDLKEGTYPDNMTGHWCGQPEPTGNVLTDLSGNGNDGQLGTTTGSDTDDPTWYLVDNLTAYMETQERLDFAPAEFDLWGLEIASPDLSEGVSSPLFRVEEISLSSQQTRRITATEYSPTVYDPNAIIDYELTTAPAYNTATGITTTEFHPKRDDGTYKTNLVVNWGASNRSGAWADWQVLWRDITTPPFDWQGYWDSGTTYTTGQCVVILSTHKAYISYADGNTGNSPATSPDYWTPIQSQFDWYYWDSSTAYTANDYVIHENGEGVEQTYQCLAGNTDEEPEAVTYEYWNLLNTSDFKSVRAEKRQSVKITDDLITDHVYQIKLQALRIDGTAQGILNSPYATVAIVGKQAAVNPTLINGTWDSEVNLRWDASGSLDLDAYEIQDSDTGWGEGTGNVYFHGKALSTSFYYPADTSTRTQIFYLRTISSTGVYADSSVTKSLTNSAPGTPSSFGAAAATGAIKLYWVLPDGLDDDYTGTQIYLDTVDGSTKFSFLSGNITELDYTHYIPATPGTAYKVKIALCDRHGPGTATSVVTVTPNEIPEGEIADGAITAAKIAASAVTAPKVATNAIEADKLNMAGWANPTDNDTAYLFHFDKNIKPATGEEPNGTTATTLATTGRFNGSITCDATSQFLQFARKDMGAEKGTIAAWVQIDTTSTDDVTSIINIGSVTGDRLVLWYSNTANLLYASLFKAGVLVVDNATYAFTPVASTWYFTACTWDIDTTGAEYITVYLGDTAGNFNSTTIDLSGYSSTFPTFASESYLEIGHTETAGNKALEGAIDEVRMDLVDRSEAEIQAWLLSDGPYWDSAAITNRTGSFVIDDEGFTAGDVDNNKYLEYDYTAGSLSLVGGKFISSTSGESGQRVVIDPADNTLKFYNASNDVILTLDDAVYSTYPGIKVGEEGIIYFPDNGFIQIANDDAHKQVIHRANQTAFESDIEVTGRALSITVNVGNFSPVSLPSNYEIFYIDWEGNLGADGDLDLAGSLTVDTNLDVDGTANLDVVDIDGTLDVSGLSDFHADVEIGADLTVTGVGDFSADGLLIPKDISSDLGDNLPETEGSFGFWVDTDADPDVHYIVYYDGTNWYKTAMSLVT